MLMAEKPPSRIRKFVVGDINKILEIEEQAFPKTPYTKETFLNYANKLPDSFSVVESGKVIVGYIIFDMSGHVHSTAVKTEYRKKGFGKKLFGHALMCTEKKLWLEVRSKNRAAIAFYKRMGMKIINIIPGYYGDDDALVMVLNRSTQVILA
jgi:ribosomal-protein-alanine N-acetyltransferase